MFSVCECLAFVASILTVIIVKRLTTEKSRAVFNVYQKPQGFFWLKTLFMYTILTLRNLKKKPLNYNELDKPQKLSSSKQAIDGVYLNGANKSGEFLVTGMARRNEDLIDGFLYLKLAPYGVLQSPKLPRTALKPASKELHSAEGITIKVIEPMKKWHLAYKGPMNDSDGKSHDVTIDMEWTSDLPYFNFDTDMDPCLMAKAVATETWSRDFFKVLESTHQTHYEQPGKCEGTVVVDDQIHKMRLDTLRDHSFGPKREWRQFYRYGIHFLSVENGDRITIGQVCMPITLSRLYMGFIYSKADNKIYPVTSCDLELYQHGEDGIPPVDYAFSFIAGKKTYVVNVNVIDSPAFYISKDNESKVIERLCKFTVNERAGWGTAEWQYRNVLGKIH